MNLWIKLFDFFQIRLRWWGFLTAAGVMAGTASLLGFLGSCHWLLDLCSHFRVQYFLGLGVTALLLLMLRQRRAAAVFGALALVNLSMVLPLYFGKKPTPAAGGIPVRAMLINVNTRLGKAADVSAAIRRFNPDFVVLEEVSVPWLSDLKPVLAGYRYSVCEPRADNFGIALFSKFPCTRSRVAYIGDADIPSIIAEIETPRGWCTVLATHPLPPRSREYSGFRNGQLAALPRWVRRATSPVLLLGDLNTTPWNYYFKRLLAESGLQDSAQGRGVQATWPAFHPLLRIPIDHCLCSPEIGIVNRQVGPDVGSDHFPLIVDFVIGGQRPAPMQR
ncbi:MAG: endonuclease/exonuclease/phosphatase family protein [Kiritimatiellaeota bacterium]|nr:endonuclease/exonuclease/phosphatase family protein [Kiritimatiellota bacterium]